MKQMRIYAYMTGNKHEVLNILDHILKRGLATYNKHTDDAMPYFTCASGICIQVLYMLSDTAALRRIELSGSDYHVSDWLSRYWEDWEYYSGDPSFPVPDHKHPKFDKGVATAGEHAFQYRDHWGGEQCLLRCDLLCHVIRKLYLEVHG